MTILSFARRLVSGTRRRLRALRAPRTASSSIRDDAQSGPTAKHDGPSEDPSPPLSTSMNAEAPASPRIDPPPQRVNAPPAPLTQPPSLSSPQGGGIESQVVAPIPQDALGGETTKSMRVEPIPPFVAREQSLLLPGGEIEGQVVVSTPLEHGRLRTDAIQVPLQVPETSVQHPAPFNAPDLAQANAATEELLDSQLALSRGVRHHSFIPESFIDGTSDGAFPNIQRTPSPDPLLLLRRFSPGAAVGFFHAPDDSDSDDSNDKNEERSSGVLSDHDLQSSQGNYSRADTTLTVDAPTPSKIAASGRGYNDYIHTPAQATYAPPPSPPPLSPPGIPPWILQPRVFNDLQIRLDSLRDEVAGILSPPGWPPGKVSSLSITALPSQIIIGGVSYVDIASGTYGRVYRGFFVDGRSFAVKIRVRKEPVEYIDAELRAERDVLSKIRAHPHPRLLEGFQLSGLSPGDIWVRNVSLMVTTYHPGGTLNEMAPVVGNDELKTRLYAGVVREIAAGLNHLHSLNLIHKDIKPNNILISSDGHCIIADYGGCDITTTENPWYDPDRQCIRQAANGGIKTIGYTAPETLFPGLGGFAEFDARADWYSLGITMYTLVCRWEPPEHSDNAVLTSAEMGLDGGEFMRRKMVSAGCPGLIREMILNLCQIHPKDRIAGAAIDSLTALLIKESNGDPNTRTGPFQVRYYPQMSPEFQVNWNTDYGVVYVVLQGDAGIRFRARSLGFVSESPAAGRYILRNIDGRLAVIQVESVMS
ncbi:kinase-like domain-containing protein [Mycena filopes]|nr:kinase-like domain-containing protein [Mycena filopes]